MELIHQGIPLIDGTAKGEVLLLSAPISFWGGVDPGTGEIIQGAHPQRGKLISGKILAIPSLIGSSSSSSVMLELLYGNHAPLALLLTQRDAILSLGVVVAREMGWGSIPIIECDLAGMLTGYHARVESGGTIYCSPT